MKTFYTSSGGTNRERTEGGDLSTVTRFGDCETWKKANRGARLFVVRCDSV